MSELKGRFRWILAAVHLCVCLIAFLSSIPQVPSTGYESMILTVIDFPWSMIFLGLSWAHSDLNYLILGNAVVGTIWWYIVGRSIDRRFLKNRAAN